MLTLDTAKFVHCLWSKWFWMSVKTNFLDFELAGLGIRSFALLLFRSQKTSNSLEKPRSEFPTLSISNNTTQLVEGNQPIYVITV